MPSRLNPARDRLPAALRPTPITITLPAIKLVAEAEHELRQHAEAPVRARRLRVHSPRTTSTPMPRPPLPATRPPWTSARWAASC